MSDRPILFSTAMVQALLAGRKTVTRRVIKPEPAGSQTREGSFMVMSGDGFVRDLVGHFRPRIQRGDRLWVRESWRTVGDAPLSECTGPSDVMFKASANEAELGIFSFKPSIHMPRWASRLTLVVTDVKVERLQGIDEEEAIAEGVEYETADPPFWYVPGIWPHSITAVGIEEPGERAGAVRSYAKLWNHINGAGAWEADPWVSATTFTVHKGNIDHMRKDDAA